MKFRYPAFLALFALLLCCRPEEKEPTQPKRTDFTETELTFRDIDGIRYYEVKRLFRNGLSFNKDGFQQEPSWIIEPKGKDSILAYDPGSKKMERFYLQFDHGKVYNFAREFFRVKLITKDSLIMQRLHVNGRIIAGDDDYRSEVFLTFYSKNYIENVLKTTAYELRKPSRADTLFIKNLVMKTMKEPANPDICFAARQPVIFLPNSKNVSAEKISSVGVDKLNNRREFMDYFYPYYRLKINKSYKEFNFTFSVIVDAWGKLHVNRVDGVMSDDIPYRKKLLEGITSVYLQNLFIIKPGTTLGMKHSSEVTVNVIGVKN